MLDRNETVVLRLIFLVGVLALLPNTALAQWKAKDTEWPTYAADLAATRYRPLDQINASNFNDWKSPGESRPTILATARSTSSKARP